MFLRVFTRELLPEECNDVFPEGRVFELFFRGCTVSSSLSLWLSELSFLFFATLVTTGSKSESVETPWSLLLDSVDLETDGRLLSFDIGVLLYLFGVN